jgi:hypothetical protein
MILSCCTSVSRHPALSCTTMMEMSQHPLHWNRHSASPGMDQPVRLAVSGWEMVWEKRGMAAGTRHLAAHAAHTPTILIEDPNETIFETERRSLSVSDNRSQGRERLKTVLEKRPLVGKWEMMFCSQTELLHASVTTRKSIRPPPSHENCRDTS